MNELSNDTMSYVIVGHDGSHRFITEAQYNLIFQVSSTDAKSVTTPQLGQLFFSSIAKIPPIKDFYEMYPDKRPQEPQYTYKNEIKLLDQVRQPTKKAMELMVKGFVNQRRIKNPNYTLEQAQKEFTLFKKSL